ncbi:MAG: hypothetical protein A2Y79_00850 [Deltaproteobacteria bacterium RBG_13_43_22]|nr:MAG: hypothetical protein A2Y79_00850 [Deltaproteobacteria bacterium RBG_13_43_22]
MSPFAGLKFELSSKADLHRCRKQTWVTGGPPGLLLINLALRPVLGQGLPFGQLQNQDRPTPKF